MNMMKKIILFFAIYLTAAIAAQAKCNLGIKFEESASKNSLFQIPIKPEVKSNHPILDHPNAWRQAYFIQKAKEVCPGQNMGDVEIKYIFNDKKLSAVIFKKINTASKKNKNNNLFFNYVKENYPLKIDSEVITHLKTYKEKSPSREFVLPRDNEKEVSKSWTSYRANIILLSLIDWLRKVGVKANKPLHALRKLAGSEVAKSKGIFAASSFLRHKSTAVTQQHYVAPAPESPNFGKFLK